ncbi:MAG TPA: threonine--tRNA ligase, partial [Syntrophales bacterium]|nr:threonine--tRNA ligase [Syntrophales bacterium]
MTSDKDKKTAEEEKLEKIRHSASHVMAEAVQSIFPDARFAIGPAIENGFYYDFDLPRPLTPDDLPVIEAKMAEIIATNTPFVREEITKEQALQLFAAQPYKLELVNELPDEKVSIYKQGSFTDLCRGPHINSTREIPRGAFKLDKIAGAYWRGSEKNKMLQRIYALMFRSKKELDEYIEKQEEIKKRDHRKIGKDLDLFVFSDLVGKGLPLFTEKGSIIRRTLERFIVDEEISRGYKHVYTPDL